MRAGVLVVFSAIVCTTYLPGASAQDPRPAFDANALRLPAGPTPFVLQRGSQLAPHRALTAGLLLGWHQAPLVLESSDGQTERAVGGQLTADVLAAVGLWDVAQLELAVPLVLLQTGTGLSPALGGGADERLEALVLRDPRVTVDGRLLRGSGGRPGLMLSLGASLPVGRKQDLGGGRWGLSPAVAMDWTPGRWRLGLQAGYRWFERVETVGSSRLGDEIVLDAAVHRVVFEERLSVGIELKGRLQLAGQPEGAPPQHALEGYLTGRWMPWPGTDVALVGVLGSGVGGAGTAAFRALLGFQYRLLTARDRSTARRPAEALDRPLPAPAAPGSTAASSREEAHGEADTAALD